MNYFIDEEGAVQENSLSEGVHGIILNTHENTIAFDKVSLFAIPWLFFGKLKECNKENHWFQLKYIFRMKGLLQIKSSFKEKNKLLENTFVDRVVVFEQLMEKDICALLKKNGKTSGSIAFVFNNQWVRMVVVQENIIIQSRLIRQDFLDIDTVDFVVVDTNIKMGGAKILSLKDFFPLESDSDLKMLSFSILKEHQNQYLQPCENFVLSLSEFYKKLFRKRILNSFIVFSIIFSACFFHQSFFLETVKKLNDSIEENLKTLNSDPLIKQKKKYISVFEKRGWGHIGSPLKNLSDFHLQEYGFYVEGLSWKINSGNEKIKEKYSFILKPILEEKDHEILKKFSQMEIFLKKMPGLKELMLLKPPFGVDKTKGELSKEKKQKSSSKVKIELIWGKS